MGPPSHLGASESQSPAALELPTKEEDAGIFILQFPSVVGEGSPGKCRLWHVQPTEATSKYVNCPHGSPGVGRSYLGRAFMASAICKYPSHGIMQTN